MVQRQLALEVDAATPVKLIKLDAKARGEVMVEILRFARERGLMANYDPSTQAMIVRVDYASR